MNCPFCAAVLTQFPNPLAAGNIGACPACLNPFVLRREGHQYQATPIPLAEDVRLKYPAESLSAILLEHMRNEPDELPVLPEVAGRVLQSLKNPDFSISDLASLIERDPIIAGKVLKLANSAMYGGLTRIGDVRSACARLGLRTVANAIQAAVSEHLYQAASPALKHRMEQYWKHSLATAHYSSEIAVMLSEPHSEVLFVAGLMHSIGRPAILGVIVKGVNPAFASLPESDVLLDELVENLYPLVGLHLIQRWNLPAEIAVATYFHLMPADVTNEALARMTHIVALACTLAHVSGYHCTKECEKSALQLPSTQILGLSDIKIAMLRTDVEERLESLIQSLTQ